MQLKMLCTEQAEQQGALMLLVHDGSRLFVSLFFPVFLLTNLVSGGLPRPEHPAAVAAAE